MESKLRDKSMKFHIPTLDFGRCMLRLRIFLGSMPQLATAVPQFVHVFRTTEGYWRDAGSQKVCFAIVSIKALLPGNPVTAHFLYDSKISD